MGILANLLNISSTKKGTYPGDQSGDSLIATSEGQGGKGETAQVYGLPGFIGNPPKGAKCIRLRIGSLDIIIAAFNYQATMPTNPGESRVYSTDADGVEQGSHYLKNDGSHVFNDGTDYAVAFEDLKTQFNELKSAFNTHTHAVTTAPGTTATALPQSAANIDAAKVEGVRLP